MAKLDGPLLSLNASGTLGQQLTFQGMPGGTRVISKPDHADTLTLPQVLQRFRFLEGKDYWHSLSDADKTTYNRLGRAQRMTGYNLALRAFLKDDHEGPCRLLLPLLEGRGASCFDYSNYDNHGVITGGTWSTLSGEIPALTFDGINDQVNLGNHSSLDITAGLTLEAIFSSPARPTNGRLINKETGGQKSYFLLMLNADRGVRFAIYTGGAEMNVRTTVPLNTGAVHYVAGVNDLTDLHIYADGVLNNTNGGAGGAIDVSTADLYLGCRAANSEWFYGMLMAARVTARAIPASEIASRYRSLKRLLPTVLN